MPYPDPRQTKFGPANTTRMLNFSKTADRIAGAQWYVDLAVAEWNRTIAAEGWTHVRFAGFYWWRENICGCVNPAQTACTMCDTEGHEYPRPNPGYHLDDAAILVRIAAHVHSSWGDQ